jgi:hypothetical protein
MMVSSWEIRMLSYKTILVHIDGSPDQPSRLQAAALLANEHGAHLVGSAATGTSWPGYVLLTGSIGAPQPQRRRRASASRRARRA